ncbi:MAG TPA: hypothetical protein VHP33_37945 [Polyangiaceae bacterium]|nr:hypothetical protein [Polyangiaceae bacterium]
MTSRTLLLPVVIAAAVAACGESNTNTPTGMAGSVASVAGSSGSGGSAGAEPLAGSAGATAGGATAGSGGATGGSGGAGGTGGGNTMPMLLSETGLYSDIKAKTLAPDVHPFVPAYTLWSDGAVKNRYAYMPPGGKIITDDMEFWQYPAGFKLWKDFTRDGKLIETRLLMKLSGGLSDWYMVAFKWNADLSDATALPMGEANAMGTMHDIPSKEDCKGCHTAMKDNSIGFTAALLTHNQPNSLNLSQIEQMGWLSTPPKAGGYPLPGDEPTKAALGYLQANCGMCHNYKSQVYKTKVTLDLWAHLDKLDTVQNTFAYLSMVCDQWPGSDKFNPITSCEAGHATGALMDTDISKTKRVAPGMSAESGIHDLMALRATGQVGMMKQMPPLGSEIIDPTGLGVVDAWINALPAQ